MSPPLPPPENFNHTHISKLQRSVDEKLRCQYVNNIRDMVKEEVFASGVGSAERSVHCSQSQFDKDTWD